CLAGGGGRGRGGGGFSGCGLGAAARGKEQVRPRQSLPRSAEHPATVNLVQSCPSVGWVGIARSPRVLRGRKCPRVPPAWARSTRDPLWRQRAKGALRKRYGVAAGRLRPGLAILVATAPWHRNRAGDAGRPKNCIENSVIM